MKVAIVLTLLALTGCDAPGRYQIAVAKGSSMQEDRVWVLDTATGRVSLCYETAARIGCLEESWAPGPKKK